MYKLRTHPEADAELDEQLGYLRERTLWQATRFADAFHGSLMRLRSHPTLSHFVWKEFRRYNIPGFSHAIIYRVEEDAIYVVAVIHEKRHPDYWKHRIDDDDS